VQSHTGGTVVAGNGVAHDGFLPLWGLPGLLSETRTTTESSVAVMETVTRGFSLSVYWKALLRTFRKTDANSSLP